MKEKNNANQVKQRFSLRKLTVGVCSVLLGLTFINGNNHTVKADSVNDNNNPDAYEEVTPHSETTTNTPVKKVVVNKEASFEPADTNNQNQAAASNNTPLSTAEYQQVNNAENANKKDSVKAQEFKTVSKSAANQTNVQSSADTAQNNGSNTAVRSKVSNARIGNASYLSQILVQKTNNIIATVNNETDLQNALSDNNIANIKLGKDINIDKAIEIKNLNRDVTLSGLNSDGTKYSKVNYTLTFTGDSQITFTGDYNTETSHVLRFNDINFYLATKKTPFVYDAKNLTTIKADFKNVYVNKTMRSDYDSDQDDSQDFLIENNQYTSTGTGTSGEGNHLNNFNMDFSGTNKFEGTAVRFTQITLEDGADVEGSLREQNASSGAYTSTIGKNAKLIMKLNNPGKFDKIWYDDGNQSLNIEQGATFELLNGNNHGSLMENAIVNSPKLVIIESNQGFTNNSQYTDGNSYKWTIQNNGQKLGLSLSKEDGPNYTWQFNGDFTITHEPGKNSQEANSKKIFDIEGDLNSTKTDHTPDKDISSKGYAEINLNSKGNFENLAGTSFTRIAFGTDLNKVFDANRYNATTNSKPVSVLLDQSGTSHYLGDARSLVKITDSENSEIDSEIDTKSIEWIDGDVYNASGNKIIGSIKNGNFTFANGLTDDTTSLKPTDANSENLNRFARIKVTYEDGTTDIVPVEIDIIKAKAKQNSQSKPLNPNNSTDITPATDNSDDAFDNAVTPTTNNNTSDNTTSNVAADYGQAIVRAGQIDVYTLPKGNLVRHHTHLNKGTRLAIYEIRKIDGQNWYRIGNSRWIMAASTINTKGSAIYLHQMLKGYAVVWVQKIAVYNKVNGKKTKTYLKRNAKRKILSVVTVNGGQWYQIGKKQWIPAASAHFVVAD